MTTRALYQTKDSYWVDCATCGTKPAVTRPWRTAPEFGGELLESLVLVHRYGPWPEGSDEARGLCSTILRGYAFCSGCTQPTKLRKVRVPKSSSTKLHGCDGRCLNGKHSCECRCGGRCHGAGVCSCGRS